MDRLLTIAAILLAGWLLATAVDVGLMEAARKPGAMAVLICDV